MTTDNLSLSDHIANQEISATDAASSQNHTVQEVARERQKNDGHGQLNNQPDLESLNNRAPADQTSKADDQVTPEKKATDTKNDWFYAPGIKGVGEKPEWFNSEKYQSIAEQAKAQRDLEKKLGHFKGAPENYELNYPDDYPEELKIPADSPQFQYWSGLAQKHGLSNELFNEIYLNQSYHDYQLGKAVQKQEWEKLGANARQRLFAIANWAKNNLEPQDLKTLQLSAQSAEMVELLENLITKTQSSSLPKKGLQREPLSQELLDKRVADPKYRNDPEFREETSLLFQQLYPNSDEDELF